MGSIHTILLGFGASIACVLSLFSGIKPWGNATGRTIDSPSLHLSATQVIHFSATGTQLGVMLTLLTLRIDLPLGLLLTDRQVGYSLHTLTIFRNQALGQRYWAND
jgi:hypothetical protein